MSEAGNASERKLMELSDHARDLLSLLSCFGPDPVPWSVLGDGIPALPDELAGVVGDRVALRRLARDLAADAQLTYSPAGLSLAPLVRRRLLEAMGETERARFGAVAIEVLDRAFPARGDEFATWEACEPLVEHARAATETVAPSGDAALAAARLLNRVAAYLASRGEYADALASIERASALAREPLAVENALRAANERVLGHLLVVALDRPVRARQAFRRALDLDRAAAIPDRHMEALDLAGLSLALGWLGDHEGARAEAAAAVAILDEIAPEHPDRARAHKLLGWALLQKGDLDDSRSQLERALELAEMSSGPECPDVAEIRNDLAVALQGLRDLEGALAQFRDALDIGERTLGPEHPDVAIIRSNLGQVLYELGDYVQAREHFEQAAAIADRTFPPGHITLWRRHSWLGAVLTWLGDLRGARLHRARARESIARSRGIMDRRHAYELGSLAWLHASLGEPEAAQVAYEHAIATLSALGVDAPRVAMWHRQVGWIKFGQGDLAGAVASFEATMEAHEDPDAQPARLDRLYLAHVGRKLGEQQSRAFEAIGRQEQAAEARGVAEIAFEEASAAVLEVEEADDLVSSGLAYIDVKELERASDALDRAGTRLTADDASEKGDARRLAEAWQRLGLAFVRRDDAAAARDSLKRALALMLGLERRNQTVEGRLLANIAHVQRAEGQLEQATETYEQAAARSLDGGQLHDHQVALSSLGRLLADRGRHEAALTVFHRRLDTLKELTPPNPYVEGVTLHDIADSHRALGELDRAIECYREAVERKRSHAGEQGELGGDVVTSVIVLTRALRQRGDLDEAAEILGELAAAFDSGPGGSRGTHALVLVELGDVLLDRGGLEEAAQSWRRAVSLQQQVCDLPSLEVTLLRLGRVLRRLKENDGALMAYGQRLAVLESLPTSRPLDEGVALRDLGNVYWAMGDPQAAVDHCRRAVDRQRDGNAEREQPREFAKTLLALGRALKASGALIEARAVLEECLALLAELPELDPLGEGVTLHDLGDLQRELGGEREAVELYRRALERKRDGGAEQERPQDVVVTLLALSRALQAAGDADAAAEMADQAEGLVRRSSAEVKDQLDVAG